MPFKSQFKALSKFRASSDESLACFVTLRELLKVLYKETSELLSLLIPLCRILVRILRVEDISSNTLKLCRNFKVEVRNLLRWSLIDSAILNSMDYSTGILYGDTLASRC